MRLKSWHLPAEIAVMRVAASILGLVIVLAVGYWVYRAELIGGAPAGAATVVDQANVAGVKSDLISIGQAERLYLAAHDSYASLDQLQQEGSIPFGSRHGYDFSVDVDGAQHFKVSATPSGAKASWPSLSIDETMQITQP